MNIEYTNTRPLTSNSTFYFFLCCVFAFSFSSTFNSLFSFSLIFALFSLMLCVCVCVYRVGGFILRCWHVIIITFHRFLSSFFSEAVNLKLNSTLSYFYFFFCHRRRCRHFFSLCKVKQGIFLYIVQNRIERKHGFFQLLLQHETIARSK